MKNILITCFGLYALSSVDVFAADLDGAKITELMQEKSFPNFLFIDLDIRQPNELECHSNARWEYVLDTSDDLGKSMLSLLLAAQKLILEVQGSVVLETQYQH